MSSLRLIPELRANALHAEALLLEKYGERDAALASAKNAVAMRSGSLEFRETLCRLLLAADAVDEAENAARDELTRNPESEWALRQLALALCAKNDRHEAKTVLKKALRINPVWVMGRIQFMELLLCGDALDEAETAAREALAHDPRWTYPNRILFCVFAARGDFSSAIAEVKIVIADNPSVVTFREALTDLLIRAGRIADAEKGARENILEFPEQGWPLLQMSKVTC